MKRTVVCAIIAQLLCWGMASGQTAGDPSAGQRLFVEVCAGCHGFDAAGNVAVGAPSLAGAESWYLERQLEKYQHGVRGAAPGDLTGARMGPMASAVASPRARADVVAYIATLAPRAPQASVHGDADKGRASYQLCAACHGAEGRGNAMLFAPRLSGSDDWYLVAQLNAFRDGVRGGSADDVYGQQMRQTASSLADQQAITDVVAYINTLD